MNQEECKYYRFGYSGCNYLCINRSVYTQSELLPNGIVREIICDKDDKWMKVRERKAKNEEWNEIDLAILDVITCALTDLSIHNQNYYQMV